MQEIVSAINLLSLVISVTGLAIFISLAGIAYKLK